MRASPWRHVFDPPHGLENADLCKYEGPRRFRNTRGRRRRPKGARTAADGVCAGAGARRAKIPGTGKGLRKKAQTLNPNHKT